MIMRARASIYGQKRQLASWSPLSQHLRILRNVFNKQDFFCFLFFVFMV